MTQVLRLSSRWNNLLVSLFISIQYIVSVSGKISPHSFEMFFHKPTTNLFVLSLVFPNNSVLTFWKGAFQDHLWQKLSFSSQFLLFHLSIVYFFLPEALWCCSPRPIILFRQDHVLSFANSFNRSVVSSLQFLFILSSFLLFSTRVLSKLYHYYAFAVLF